jgi:hypothetical protein
VGEGMTDIIAVSANTKIRPHASPDRRPSTACGPRPDPTMDLRRIRRLLIRIMDCIWVRIFCNGKKFIDSAKLIAVELSG